MNKAVFLDRDGVINEVLSSRVKFVNKPEQMYLLDRVGEGIKLLNDAGYLVFVVTNQGGVGLGYMKENNLKKVHEKMKKEIAKSGGKIDDIIYCPHKPNAGCACRKPEPEMLLTLAQKHQVSLHESFMVGDRDVDILAGKQAGTKTILIGNEEGLADIRFPTLYDAASWITTEQ
ncbi:D-glycero-beta-D-manno-heptose-1,7-bisphosphate 7-phosphatase [Bacillus sp. UMB0899]|uniref:D-glycero-alpha-D-manno-heptose-1,7-bisphosphate 7-phosphatase n=1 Tax=Metabacillus schmidteae TaxID=2730405 RepID=UPI000C807D67|nr:HAD family hydrolase [Metabacillus schmidteae]PMC35278.1 D-glycero-beta-D-manno-heptose-1,7-bisphosphate 7-phosphatase [Bacillus sp. UMB0899]